MSRVNTERLQVSVSPELYSWLAALAAVNRRSISSQARAILEGARAGDDGLPGKRDPAVADTTAPEVAAAPWPGERLVKRDKSLPWSIICRSRDQHRIGVACPECQGTGPR